MIEQQGRVVRSDAANTWVDVGPQGGCSACDAGRGCGAGLFGRLLRRRPLTLKVSDDSGLQPGAVVSLGIPEMFFLRLVLRLYALPLVAGLAGAWICHYLSDVYGLSKAATDGFSLAGLAGFAWLAMTFGRSAPMATAPERWVTIRPLSAGSACAAAAQASGRAN